MKIRTVLALLLWCLLLTAACGGGGGGGDSSGDSLVGTWNMTSSGGQSVPAGFFLTFNADGSGTFRYQALGILLSVSGTWTRSGDNLTLRSQDGTWSDQWRIDRLTSSELQLSNQTRNNTSVFSKA